MEKVKILVVEDELIIAEDIRVHLIDMGYEVTDIVVSYNEALQSIMRTLPDLALVDIRIAGSKDGIELGSFFREEIDLPFIYLTSHSDKNTVARAKATQPNAYLLKPFKPDNLYVSIEMALANARTNSGESINESQDIILKDCLFIKKDNHFVKIKIAEICNIHSEGNYLILKTSDSDKFIVRSTILNMLESLPENDFFQTHKSHIINLNFLDSIGWDHVKVKGYEVPLSKQRRELLMNRTKTLS